MGKLPAIRAIVNPAAGSGRAMASWPRVAMELRDAGLDFDAIFTRGPLEATTLTRDALRAGIETVLAVGGDGTVNEVVNGFFERGSPIAPDARLGVICVGTGSDLIRTLGVPRGPAAAKLIANGNTRRIDLGWAECIDDRGQPHGRFFANVADLGLGGETARRVNQSSKALGGFVSFLRGAIVTILRYQPKQARIQLDDRSVIEGRMSIVVAANGRYFAGGMFIAPCASLCDGQFDVLVLDDVDKLDLITTLLPRVYLGKHLTHPHVLTARASRMRITSEEPMLVELDGEQPGRAEAEFRIVPGALNVIVGKTLR